MDGKSDLAVEVSEDGTIEILGSDDRPAKCSLQNLLIVEGHVFAVIVESERVPPLYYLWGYHLDRDGKAFVSPIADYDTRSLATALYSASLNPSLFQSP